MQSTDGGTAPTIHAHFHAALLQKLERTRFSFCIDVMRCSRSRKKASASSPGTGSFNGNWHETVLADKDKYFDAFQLSESFATTPGLSTGRFNLIIKPYVSIDC